MNAEDRGRIRDIQDAHLAMDAIEGAVEEMADLVASVTGECRSGVLDQLDTIRRVLPAWQV